MSAYRDAIEAAALTRLMDQFVAADEAGEFGECCQDPCPACTFGQWLDTKVAAAQSTTTDEIGWP